MSAGIKELLPPLLAGLGPADAALYRDVLALAWMAERFAGQPRPEALPDPERVLMALVLNALSSALGSLAVGVGAGAAPPPTSSLLMHIVELLDAVALRLDTPGSSPPPHRPAPQRLDREPAEGALAPDDAGPQPTPTTGDASAEQPRGVDVEGQAPPDPGTQAPPGPGDSPLLHQLALQVTDALQVLSELAATLRAPSGGR